MQNKGPKKAHILCIILTAVIAVSILPAVYAGDAPLYLALGDSISTGYGLADGEPSFAEILASELEYTLDCQAVDGNTASGVLEALRSGALDGAVESAELITLTCGGNDLMALLYGQIAAAYNAANAEQITAGDVIGIFSDSTDPRFSSLLISALGVLPGFSGSEEFGAGLAAYETALGEVMSYIRQRNPDAAVIVTTQYNPYKAFAASVYAILSTSIDAGAVKLNETVTKNAEAFGYTAADVYTAFAGYAEDLCNAKTSPAIDLDFHPNAAGHRVIAETVIDVLGVTAETTEETTVTEESTETEESEETEGTTVTEEETTEGSTTEETEAATESEATAVTTVESAAETAVSDTESAEATATETVTESADAEITVTGNEGSGESAPAVTETDPAPEKGSPSTGDGTHMILAIALTALGSAAAVIRGGKKE